VLKERGFNVVVDGRMGSRTMEAITAFQRQQGFQVSGRSDNQTISALELSNKIGAQDSATTGQGGASAGPSGPLSRTKAPTSPRPAVRAVPTSSRHPLSRTKAPTSPRPAVRAVPTSSRHPLSRTNAPTRPQPAVRAVTNQQQAPAQQHQPAGQGQQNSGNK
jgi:peptidoglycan hydrolase-like protein with peptidoglycan-binding domain